MGMGRRRERWIYVIAVLGDDRGCTRVWVTYDGMDGLGYHSLGVEWRMSYVIAMQGL